MQSTEIRKGWVTPDAVREPLYVITPVFNPIRYKSRWKLYQRFARMVEAAGGTLYTAELAFGEREFALEQVAPQTWAEARPLTDTKEHGADCRHDDPKRCMHKYFKYRTTTELWMKEKLINVVAQQLPADWKYVAFIDCDVAFIRPNWVGECIHQLQHYDFLQMFTRAHDVNSKYEIYTDKPGFMEAYETGEGWPTGGGCYYYYGKKHKHHGMWSGLAWACTRRGWDTVGGLLDTPITGAADWYMAWALIGKVYDQVPKGSTPGFARSITRWQDRWMNSCSRLNVGAMTGSVVHYHHGPKKDRQYIGRTNLLTEFHFDPNEDLKLDSQGLWQWQDHHDARSVGLHNAIRKWFRQRNEDDPNT